MRLIKGTSVLLGSTLAAVLLLVGLTGLARTQKKRSNRLPHTTEDTLSFDTAAAQLSTTAPLRPSLLISIPFGFAPAFPLRNDGHSVLVQGHGSCTAGGTFTVAVTVTHAATGAVATGDVSQPCAGEAIAQTWHLTATAVADPLAIGPAASCGLVQTIDGDTVTDRQEWCVDVMLGDYLFLPLVAKQE